MSGEECWPPCCGGAGCPSCGDGTEYAQRGGLSFARPGANSALRAATRSNPRNLPCPTCRQPNKLTPADKRAGYQCDACADREEGHGGYGPGGY